MQYLCVMKRIVRAIGFISGMSLALGCAKVGQINGGPRDTDPPKMVEGKSTPNHQTGVRPREITLTFDEFVKLKSPYANIVISPPLEKKFTIVNKGKKVILRLDEEETLKDSTTYIVQFGDAIIDFNEGNAAKNLTFLFSTGDHIDSLRLEGKVVDAFTGEPVKDVLVMLYDRNKDSLPVQEKPYYFAKTSASGDFHLKYLKRDRFMLFALKDENLNYKYDLPKEKIGFIDSMVFLQDSNPPLSIRVFTPLKGSRIVDTKSCYRTLKVVFSTSPISPSATSLEGDTLPAMRKKDTFFVLLPSTTTDTSKVLILDGDKLMDTVTYLGGRPGGCKVPKAGFDKAVLSTEGPKKGWILVPNQWLRPNRANIRFVRDDSLIVADSLWTLEVDTTGGPWHLYYPWTPQHKYRVNFLPGALVQINDSLSKDTIAVRLPVVDPEEMSGLTVKVVHLKKSTPLLITLESDNKTLRQWCFTPVDSIMSKHWSLIPPGQYQLRIVEDINANCQWDPGSWWMHRQPETVVVKKLDKLRANWDTEVKVEGF